MWHRFVTTFQHELVGSGNGQNIKTVGGVSLLGSGNVGIDSLGVAYGTCSSSGSTLSISGLPTGFTAKDNGLLAVRFSNDVAAGASIVIGNTTMSIYHRLAVLTAGTIKAGETALFSLQPSNLSCILLSVDRTGVYVWNMSGLDSELSAAVLADLADYGNDGDIIVYEQETA